MKTRLLLLCAAAALAVTACGGGDDPVAATTTSTTAADAEPPERIVSLSPTATEMLYAIGAGDQVTAVDKSSTYPEGTPVTDISGFRPNVEAVIGLEPDLVVLGRELPELEDALETIDVPVVVNPAAVEIDDVYEQLENLGEATGHRDEAADVADDIREGLDAVVAEADGRLDGLTYYYELTTDYYSATSDTFIGALLELLGLENIADRAGDTGDGYPQLSAEFIVEQNPDLVLLAEPGQDEKTVAARPGWSGMKAVSGGGVIPLDPDLASRWGPRMVLLLESVVEGASDVVAAG